MQKRNGDRKECEEKENKRKEVRGYQHIKVVEVRFLNLNLDLLWNDLGVKLGGIIEDYKTLYSHIFKRKNMFCESYELLKTLC